MSTQWESVVRLARDVDAAFANGHPLDGVLVMRLSRAVLDFQKQLVGPGLSTRLRPASSTPNSDAAA